MQILGLLGWLPHSYTMAGCDTDSSLSLSLISLSLLTGFGYSDWHMTCLRMRLSTIFCQPKCETLRLDLFPVSFPWFSFSSILCPFGKYCFPITNEPIFLSIHLLNLPEGILASSGYIKRIKAAENQSNNNKGSIWSGHHMFLCCHRH